MAIVDKEGVDSFLESTDNYEKEGLLTKTTNQAGWQMNALDEYGRDFVKFASHCTRPILDLGVAFGFTSKELLKVGASVVANDISEEMLDELEKSVKGEEEKKRLSTKPGNVMQLTFDDNQFDGIWANRLLHYLRPEEIRTLLRNCYKWLAPGGKLCITAASQHFAQCDMAVYNQRVDEGEEWPGFLEMKEEGKSQWDGVAKHFNWLSREVLEREVKKAEFEVEKVSYIARPYAGSNGKEGVGIMAAKKK